MTRLDKTRDKTRQNKTRQNKTKQNKTRGRKRHRGTGTGSGCERIMISLYLDAEGKECPLAADRPKWDRDRYVVLFLRHAIRNKNTRERLAIPVADDDVDEKSCAALVVVAPAKNTMKKKKESEREQRLSWMLHVSMHVDKWHTCICIVLMRDNKYGVTNRRCSRTCLCLGSEWHVCEYQCGS
jgi:hypothetical protein